MKMKSWLLACAFAMSGCAVDLDGTSDHSTDESVDENVAISTTTEVAHVVTADGTIWRFIEGDLGDLFVWSTEKLPDGARPVVDHSLDELRPIDLYRRLTSAAPPRALVDAQARADAPEADPPGSAGPDDDESSGDPNGITPRISASSFEDNYCYEVWDYHRCWPATHGNPYVQYRGYHIIGHMAAVSVVTHARYRSRRFKSSSWGNYLTIDANPGEVHRVRGNNVSKRYTRRFEILDNGTHEVRYSFVGKN